MFSKHQDKLVIAFKFMLAVTYIFLNCFSYIFWMGDLNFRLAQDSFDHEQIVESVKNDEFGRLLGKDQLNLVRREEQAFHELSEKLPNFAPTYKFVIGTEEYDKK